jgi:hypothetical protein
MYQVLVVHADLPGAEIKTFFSSDYGDCLKTTVAAAKKWRDEYAPDAVVQYSLIPSI